MICREITKYYEEYIRTNINDLSNLKFSKKGEITVVISENSNLNFNQLEESDKRMIKKLIKKMSVKDIIKEINNVKKISKKLIYDYCIGLKMKIKNFFLLLIFIILTGCVGYSSTGVLGTGVSIALDPRTLGTQIDDSVMQQNLRAKIIALDKKFIISKDKSLRWKNFFDG